MSSLTSHSGGSARTSSLFLLHSFTLSESSSSGGGSMLDLLSAHTGGTIASLPVSSTVKGAGNHHGAGAKDRIELVEVFAGGAYAACTFKEPTNHRLVIYSLATHQKHNQSTLPEHARALLVDPLSRYLLVGSLSGRLRIYFLSTGTLLTADLKTHHDRGINVLAMDRAAKWCVVGGQDGIISVYDFAALLASAGLTGQARAQAQAAALTLSISDHTQPITTLHITASNRLLTGSKDGSVRFYTLDHPVSSDASSALAHSSSSSSIPAPPCLLHQVFRGAVNAVAMDATEAGAYIACNDLIHYLPLYPSRTSSSHTPSPGWVGHGATVKAMELDESGTRLISVDAEGVAKLWEAGGLSPSSSPSSLGTCLKTFPKRPGCDSVKWVRDASGKGEQARIATVNTHAMQHAAPARGGTGLAGRESGWIFPPLNSSLVTQASAAAGGSNTSTVYIPVSLTPTHGALNSDLRSSLLHSALAPTHRKRRWADDAEAELASGAGAMSDVLVEGSHYVHPFSSSSLLSCDLSLLTGSSGWSSLASSSSSLSARLDATVLRAEAAERQVREMYQLAVEKVWKDVKEGQQAGTGEQATATAGEAQPAQRRKR